MTVLIFATLAIYSLRTFRNVGEDLQNIVTGHLVLARLTGQLETHQQNRFRDLRRGLDESNNTKLQTILRISNAYHPQMIQTTISDATTLCRRQLLHLKPPKGKSAQLEAKRDFYQNVLKQIERIEQKHTLVNRETESLISQSNTSTGTIQKTTQIVENLEAKLIATIYQLNKNIDEQTERAVHRAQQNERTTAWRIVTITVLALLLGIMLAIWSTRALAPIHELVNFARAISRGDYQRKITVRGDDELSALGKELKLMAAGRQKREEELDQQQDELERAYHRVADLKNYHESVVESLRTAIIVTDRQLIITSANQAVEANFEIEPKAILGQSLAKLELRHKIAAFTGALHEILEHNESKNIDALKYSSRLYEAAIVPFRNDQGMVIGLVIAAEDVTNAIQTKEALIRSERLAAIGRMSAHVTHEIRNPLSSIGLNAEILETLKPEDTEQSHQICQAIIREVDRLTAITEAYLNFARLPRPSLRHENPKALLESIATFVEHDCAAANVTITVESFESDMALNIDSDQIRQALLNLVRNAKESMPNGGAITLIAESLSQEIKISVRDNGVGIEKTELDRIFDPFFSTKQTGTGLGLALVQQIIQEHGGRLAVQSSPGSGTQFDLFFKRGSAQSLSGTLDQSFPS